MTIATHAYRQKRPRKRKPAIVSIPRKPSGNLVTRRGCHRRSTNGDGADALLVREQ